MATKYRDQEAKENQEVLTPPELVNEIYSELLKIDPDILRGAVLDPCVGPGALIEPLWTQSIDLTVADIQPNHIKAIAKKAKEKGIKVEEFKPSIASLEVW